MIVQTRDYTKADVLLVSRLWRGSGVSAQNMYFHKYQLAFLHHQSLDLHRYRG